MQDKPRPTGTERDSEAAEHVVLSLLLDPSVHGPWSVLEIGEELGERLSAIS
jgi:hypothetical protein